VSVDQKRLLVTPIPGPRSQDLDRRAAASVSDGVGSLLPVYVERAAGGIVVDVDGNHLIDFGSGIAVTTVGNAAPRVVAAIQSQAENYVHTCYMVTPYEPYVAVAEKLNELTPGDDRKKSALFNSGAEAVENAIKIARRYTGRNAVVAFDYGYHGRTNLTMALTAGVDPYKTGFGPFASEIYHAPAPDPYRWPTGRERCATECLAAFVDTVERRVGTSNTAAVIIEPIQGEGGFIVPPPGFLQRLADWCAERGIVFIADEIQTGFCRTGEWFACDHERVVPDLVTMGKGIAGGMPLSALCGRAEVMDAVQPGGIGGTYGGNPVACTAALAAIDTMATGDLCAAARDIEAALRPRLEALARDAPIVGDVRGRGAMLAIEFVMPDTDRRPNPAATRGVVEACHRAGLIALTAGGHKNVVRLLPPLSISGDLLDEGMEILAAAVRGQS